MTHARRRHCPRSVIILAALAAMAVLVGACPAAAQAAQAAQAARGELPDSTVARAEPVLRPGDVVRITVWRKPELSGEFQVADDGTVGEPFYMSVTVAGIPFTEAATRVRAHVERFETQPQVLVEPLFRVGVGGEVQRPDMYTFGHSVTVGQVVLLAGGPTPRGDPGRVWLYRAGDRLRVNMYQPDDPVARSPIRSGDYVVVESERQVVRDYVLPTLLAVGATASIARLLIR
jgi:protein involved in polysaccharide export with SLBB domain